ncbi:DUF503 domain-containing protein [uncultured Paludibaculum sp.]|uniref:DUF503 domain-containing protein n=1 Tax=uncultured Paludibaculum sp. TaxID=1765020 RepID=UPI002AAAF121|nr:DUF503 domain-containing protein [uncultured Paludibaculum sp.]
MAAIGVLILELELVESHSLKDKRHWVRGLKDRLRAGFNLAVAEVDDQNLLNRAVVTAVTVSGSRENAAKVLEAAERAAAGFLGPNLVSSSIDWLE